VGRNGRAGVLLKIRNAGMQGQELLRPAGILKADLASFLLPGGPMGLFDQVVTAGGRDDLDVLHAVEHWKYSNSCSVAPEFIGVNDVWYVVIDQEPFKEGLRRLSISPSLEEKVQHCAGIIDGLPQPELFALDLDADLIQKPPGTPSRFPVPQFLSKQRSELDVPLAKRLMTDLDPALLEQFLNITLAEREAVIEPESVLDDAQRKSVAVRLTISHGQSAYRD